MTDIPLLSGISANEAAEFNLSYPLNLEPVAIDNKIAKGQLRSAAGAVTFATGPGVDRGGVVWQGQHYRVMGTKLVRIDAVGAVSELGDIPGDDLAVFDYSFDRLGIAADGKLYYYDLDTLSQVTDSDLGTVLDMVWVDSYFMTTDGEFLVVTELSDPTQVEPLKYGSAEEDPDKVKGLAKVRNEILAIGRYTIEFFANLGTSGFPFQKADGATIPYGAISRTAKCNFAETLAFCGSAKGESLGVYVTGAGTATKISTRTIDDAIAALPDPENIVLEARASRDEQRLYVHTSAGTFVYLLQASRAFKTAVWYEVRSAGQTYRLRNAVELNGSFYVGDTDSAKIGRLVDDESEHFGQSVPWQFEAGLVYNDGIGGILHTAELVGLPGRSDDEIFFSISRDAQYWSNEVMMKILAGQRERRLQFRPNAQFGNILALRFRGRGTQGFAKLKAEIEALGV